jgi:hypothetical protein
MSEIMNSDSTTPPIFSDEAHKVASLALELWKSVPKIREGEDDSPGINSTLGAIQLLSVAKSQLILRPLVSDFAKLDSGRTFFDFLLEEPSQKSLPKGQTRRLGRITQKPKLKIKIREVFPSRDVFLAIEQVVGYESADGGAYVFRDMTSGEIANRALEKCDEQEKAALTLHQLELHVHHLRNGFVPNELKRYPFQREAKNEEWRLFRASDDICLSGWLSNVEEKILSEACHTSNNAQVKK